MCKLIIVMLFTLSSNVFVNKLNVQDVLSFTLEDIRTQYDIPAMAVVTITDLINK